MEKKTPKSRGKPDVRNQFGCFEKSVEKGWEEVKLPALLCSAQYKSPSQSAPYLVLCCIGFIGDLA